jgi:hypothetical protein
MRSGLACHAGCFPVVGALRPPPQIGVRAGAGAILGTLRLPASRLCGAGGGRGARALLSTESPSDRGARPLLAAAARLFCWPPGADRPEWREIVFSPTARRAPANLSLFVRSMFCG